MDLKEFILNEVRQRQIPYDLTLHGTWKTQVHSYREQISGCRRGRGETGEGVERHGVQL